MTTDKDKIKDTKNQDDKKEATCEKPVEAKADKTDDTAKSAE